ncbi:BQ5605_C002g01128 [Microbotryum silenes-dioicae]|uniref:BQ5605_C002g01128 protein n=1 Tax=Microbotryum silenes-dioicae TaxID=796604 RepID=A0A2X0P134_9BASI|nr:BQ5605_C002g01128 [Microbotryum silenes-dioicae]
MSTILNKPYDAFADEEQDVAVETTKKASTGGTAADHRGLPEWWMILLGEEQHIHTLTFAPTVANHIHIRIQQRNGRKTITTLQGVPTEYDPKKLLKAFKKEFACNGSLVDDEEMGQVIQLQGDQRTKIAEILIEEGIDKETIKLHGF